eukprot:gene3979-5701_t
MDPIHNKVIITTSNKAQAIRKLNDYWQLKSYILKIENDPKILTSPAYQAKAIKFLEDHSAVNDNAFWNKLSDKDKAKVTEVLNFQDIPDEKHFRIQPTSFRSEVFIILSGKVSVKPGLHSDPTIYYPGEIFGATDYFNSFEKGVEPDYHAMKNGGFAPQSDVITARAERAVLIRLSFHDFNKHILNPEKPQDDAKQREEDSSIAMIKYEDFVDDDVLCVKIFKMCKKVLNNHMFAFMDSYKLIPRNGSMPSIEFYHEGNLGREIILSENDDPKCVYFVLEGSIRLDITPYRNNNKTPTMSLKRKGKKVLSIKTAMMSIMLFEPGSMILFESECFHVGQSFVPKTKENSRKTPVNRKSKASSTSSIILNHDNHKLTTIKSTNTFITNDNDRITSPKKSPLGKNNVILNPNNNNSNNNNNDSINNNKIMLKIQSSKITLTPSGSVSNITNYNRSQNKQIILSNDLNIITKPLYSMKLVFDKPTKYLKIPYELFTIQFTDENMQTFGKGIRNQLLQANNSVLTCLQKHKSWILGNLDLNSNQEQKRLLSKSLDSVSARFLLEDLSSSELTDPIGSFSTTPNLAYYESQVQMNEYEQFASNGMSTYEHTRNIPFIPNKYNLKSSIYGTGLGPNDYTFKGSILQTIQSETTPNSSSSSVVGITHGMELAELLDLQINKPLSLIYQ